MFLKVLEHKIIAIDFQLNALEHLDAETKRSERVPKKTNATLEVSSFKTTESISNTCAPFIDLRYSAIVISATTCLHVLNTYIHTCIQTI